MADLTKIEGEQTRRRGGAADRSDGRGGMPTACVVIRIDRAADGGVDFEPEQVGERHGGAVCRLGLGGSQRGGQQGHARMAQQRERRVVEVVGVSGGAVGERGPRGRRAQRGTDHRAERRAALGPRDLADDPRDRLGAAGEHDADRVERRATDARDGITRTVIQAGLDDELGDPGDGAHGRGL